MSGTINGAKTERKLSKEERQKQRQRQRRRKSKLYQLFNPESFRDKLSNLQQPTIRNPKPETRNPEPETVLPYPMH